MPKRFIIFKHYNFSKQHGSLKIMNISVFSYYAGDRYFWFRVFNHGLCIKDTTKYEMLFSERNGLIFKLMIGKWLIKSVNS